VAVLALLFIFLVGVKGLGDGFKMLGRDLLDSFFTATENPFIGLMVGILATTLAQSSSVTTSMIVALVAAPDNPLPLANAVPMIMGANIGTTVTNTIVSMAHMARPAEFRRAFAVATCHDFFNLFAVATLLPLELATGYLRRSATILQGFLPVASALDYQSPFEATLKLALAPFRATARLLSDSSKWQGAVLILASAVLIFIALIFVVKLMRSLMETRVETYLTRALSQGAVVSIIVGAIVTIMVQSSSITTSLLVPMAGAGVLSLRRAFPLTLGANIGTTVTALLASLGTSGPHAAAGMTIALVHLLFNLTATLLVYPVRAIRNLPLAAARRLAHLAADRRRWAIIYVLVLFYGLPALCALLNQLLS
jgi:solute carrier family 34 (sodium-dependent phosphate cotransporter)